MKLKIVIVLNKCDMLGEGGKRDKEYKKKLEKVQKAFSRTKYSKIQEDVKFLPFSAAEAAGDPE